MQVVRSFPKGGVWFALFITLLLVEGCEGGKEPQEAQGAERETRLPPSKILAPSPELLAIGQQTYRQVCAICHGNEGRGDGPTAASLSPKPRDFVAAKYRLVTTWNGIPTDEDLFLTISRGIPGTVMPPFAHLPEATRWALVHYLKSLAQPPFEARVAESEENSENTGVIEVPAESIFDARAKECARERYQQACAPCHGKTGKGDGAKKLVNSEGDEIRPRDFTQGVFKGSSSPTAIYRRIIGGMPGTPMPKSDWAYGEEAWHLTHLVLSMGNQERNARESSKGPVKQHSGPAFILLIGTGFLLVMALIGTGFLLVISYYIGDECRYNAGRLAQVFVSNTP